MLSSLRRRSSVIIEEVNYNNHKHQQALIHLMEAYANDLMGGGEPLPDYTKNNLVERLSELPNALSVLAWSGSHAVGLVNCFEGFSTFRCKPLMNIHDVVVLEKYRGKGVCYQLLDYIQSVAIQRGCCKLTLEVLEGNKSARIAYKKFGFKGYELDPRMGHALFWDKIL